MLYNPVTAGEFNQSIRTKLVCQNTQTLLNVLDDKAETRLAASRVIPTVPFLTIERQTSSVPSVYQDKDSIVQVRRSSGGNGTFIVRSGEEDSFFREHPTISHYLISPFFEGAPSINVHFFVDRERVYALPGSMQIIQEVGGRLLYAGSDFETCNGLGADVVERARLYGRSFLKRYQGYRGVIGIDFLVVDGEPLFVEANPRFQASTFLLNRALANAGLPTLQEIQLRAFSGMPCDQLLQEAEHVCVHESFVAYLPETWNRPDIDIKTLVGHGGIVDVLTDGYERTKQTELEAYLFKAVFSRSVTGTSAEGTIEAHENLLELDSDISRAILAGDVHSAKISLINQGIRFSNEAMARALSAGGIREGVFSSVDIEAFGGLKINCPYGTGLSCLSPWLVDVTGQGFELRYRGISVSEVSLDHTDPLANNMTSRMTPYSTYCFLATDRLRVHHAPSCYFQNMGLGCGFCNVTPDKTAFKLEDVFEALDDYMKRGHYRHYLVGGGSGNPASEFDDILAVVRYIRMHDNRPIYLMCLPPKDLSYLDECQRAGIDEVAFNIEIFDRNIARRLMPGKGAIPLAQYMAALEHAVMLWGNTGKVRSILVAGLEPMDSLMAGVKTLCSLGVAPILSAFRPLEGTRLSHAIPPSNEWLIEAYTQAQRICTDSSLSLGPDCLACQNNVLAFPPGLS